MRRSRAAFLSELDRLGAVQLAATLGHLAESLPGFAARVGVDGVRVRGPL